jgi:preprotein translocase subunit SecG
MELFVTIIHVIVAIFLVIVVLVQGGNQGGMGAAFGGGNTQGVFGAAGATSFLGKLTYGAAFIFMLSTIALTAMQGQNGDKGVNRRLKEAHSSEVPGSSSSATQPVETKSEAPAPQAVPSPAP